MSPHKKTRPCAVLQRQLAHEEFSIMAPPPMMNDEVHHGKSRPSHLRRRFSIVRVIFGEEFWLLVLCQKCNLGARNGLKMVYEQAQKIRDEQGDTFLAVEHTCW